MDGLDVELVELVDAVRAVRCARCALPWPLHGDAGGPVTVVAGGFSSPAAAVPLTCPGFAWIDPGGPGVGSYREPPESAAAK